VDEIGVRRPEAESARSSRLRDASTEHDEAPFERAGCVRDTRMAGWKRSLDAPQCLTQIRLRSPRITSIHQELSEAEHCGRRSRVPCRPPSTMRLDRMPKQRLRLTILALQGEQLGVSGFVGRDIHVSWAESRTLDRQRDPEQRVCFSQVTLLA